METKKIFVLGNGFDLAHYLPTAYIHFMEAMQVIESSEPNTALGFDDLFKSRLDNQDKFFLRTKELYKTDDLILTAEIVDDLREKLKNNGWYQHFKHHLSDVDTWIDFESEIEKVLLSFIDIFKIQFNYDTILESYKVQNFDYMTLLAEDFLEENERVLNPQFFNEKGVKSNYYWQLLKHFKIIKTVYSSSFFDREIFNRLSPAFNLVWKNRIRKDEYEKLEVYEQRKNDTKYETLRKQKFEEILNTHLLKRYSDRFHGFDEYQIFKSLTKSLKYFSQIFEIYILNIVNNLEPKINFKACRYLEGQIEAVFTFNYTDSFQRFYPQTKLMDVHEVKHIHGSADKNNIVLGISDLDDSLKKYKIYSFIKAHQKIINNTDYQFLDEPSLEVKNHIYGREIEKNPYEFIVWGHSLDISDEEYIKDIFKLNGENARYTSILTIWYHSEPHSSLANLMNIMGKDIIQEWVKKGWLKFEKSPDIYQAYQDHYKE